MAERLNIPRSELLRIPEFVRRQMTQREMAKALGVSQPTIRKLLTNRSYYMRWPKFVKELKKAQEEVRKWHRDFRKCTTCYQVLPKTINYFSKASNKHGLSSICLSCIRAKSKERYEKAKVQVLTHYSHGKMDCCCCGENRIEFLSIDHINGNGTKHREQEIKGKYPSIHFYLVANGFPSGYRVLCMNCNYAMGFHGKCPHHSK